MRKTTRREAPPVYGKTKEALRFDWTCHRMTWPLAIPAGTRCRKITEGSTAGRYWIDDLSWIDGGTDGFLKHDATYYGIDIAPEHVEPI